MKPNFALTLTFEGIGLLHRAFPGWHLVGEVSLDSSDLAGDLAALRAKARALDASGLRSKLVIPNDQIRYIQFDAEDSDPDDIAAAVRRNLEGATPYALDELVYDWSISAGQVHVAAVARETLDEAETFAAEHGFNPLSFVAIPEARDFVGEPWFGATTASASVLPEGGQIERDTAAIRVIGAAHLPEPQARSEAEPMPTPAPEFTPTRRDVPSAEAIPPAPPAPDNAEDAGEKAEDTSVDTTPPVPASETTPAPAPEAEPTPEPEPEPEQEPQLSPEPEPEQKAEPDPEPEPQPEPAKPAAAPEEAGEKAAPVAFSSIRARRDDLPAAAPRLSGATRGATPASETPRPEADADTPPLTAAPPPPVSAPGITGTPEDSLEDGAAASLGAFLRPDSDQRLSARAPAEPVPEPERERAPSFFTRRSVGLKRGTPRRAAAAAAAGAQPFAPEDEKQRMTIFGAREPVRVGGKPRYLGLILTAVLLLFLVGVAAWASIFLDDGLARFLRSPDEPRIVATPEAETETAAGTDLADGEPEDTGDDVVVAALSDPTAGTDDPAADPMPEPGPAELSPDEARARYAATGIWQMAPEVPTVPGIITLEDFYLTSIDPQVTQQDAIALPDAQALRIDRRPATPAPPPAPGTTFRLDPRGFVLATPEGALTPDGVRVIAGKPPLLPPPRPGAPAAAPNAAPDPEVARLAAFRPRARPGDLAEQNERGTLGLGGRTRVELAELRPRLRPPSVQELAQQAAAEAAQPADPGDPEAIEEAVAAAVQTPDPFAGATAQAVSASLKPKTRPRNFDRIVRRTEEAQAAQPVPAAQRIAPSAPTATTVARAATEQNAIKLRQVNLIGVYGTPSNRRALVRLANGSYKKVKVGDRLDGGSVAAIGDSELRYVKGGRNVTLKMPRG